MNIGAWCVQMFFPLRVRNMINYIQKQNFRTHVQNAASAASEKKSFVGVLVFSHPNFIPKSFTQVNFNEISHLVSVNDLYL